MPLLKPSLDLCISGKREDEPYQNIQRRPAATQTFNQPVNAEPTEYSLSGVE